MLTDQELVQVYNASLEHPNPFGQIVSLLVLTGMRRYEVVSIQWDWINQSEQTITIPADVTKNKRMHSQPCGDLVAAVLENTPEIGHICFRLAPRLEPFLMVGEKARNALMPLSKGSNHTRCMTCAEPLQHLTPRSARLST